MIDLCAVAVPASTYAVSELTEGETGGSPSLGSGQRLPFGVTILAGRGRDEMVLEVAKRFQDAMMDMKD